MACALTQDYNLDCRDSVGGVQDVYIAALSAITAIALDGSVTDGITKATGKRFFKYSLVVETAEADEAVTFSRENGTSFVKQTVKFPINKMSVTVRDELLLLGKNRLYIVVVDNNGIGWLYGYGNGLMMDSLAAKTGVKYADRNGYELSFSGMEKQLAYQVSTSDLAELLTPGT